MNDTVKRNQFVSEPMGEKSVSKIPGLGPFIAKKLIEMGYPKAVDIYNKLKSLNFNKGKFQVWLTLKCKGAKFTPIYQSLMDWHAQFGEEESNGAENSNAESSTPRPSTSRGGGTRKSAVKKHRSSVQFDLPPESQERTNNYQQHNGEASNNNSLHNFLMSFSGVVKNISQDLHTEFMEDILKVIKDYESRSKN